MMRNLRLVAIAFLVASPADAGYSSKASPVRRVVIMLQAMQKKLVTDAVREEKLFDRFQCSCKENLENLGRSIADAQERQPQLESTVQETQALKEQLEQELASHEADRTAANEALEQAQAMRNRDKDSFERQSTEMRANIMNLGRAITALEGPLGEGFLQTASASAITRLVAADKIPVRELSRYDRQMVVEFLQHGSSSRGTGEVTGILKQMKENMEHDLQTMTEGETAANASFEALRAAKQTELTAAAASIEDKQGRHGDAVTLLVEQQQDLTDTVTGLAGDQALLGQHETECTRREQDYGILRKTMAMEAVALADTVKLLSGEDAKNLFGKTMPTPPHSFLQIDSAPHRRTAQAIQAVQRTAARFPEQPALGLLASQTISTAKQHHKGKHHNRNPGFGQILELVEKMIALLGKNQEDEDLKKRMCDTEIQKETDRKAALEEQITAKSSAIENTKDRIDTVTRELDALKEGIEQLDKSVRDATEQRKEENKNFLEVIAGNNQAVELLHMAESRLNKFYNPSLYAPPSSPAASSSLLLQAQGELSTRATAGFVVQAPAASAGVVVQAPQDMSLSADSSFVLPPSFVQLGAADAESDDDDDDDATADGDDDSDQLGFFTETDSAVAAAATKAAAAAGIAGNSVLAAGKAGPAMLQARSANAGSAGRAATMRRGSESDEFGFFVQAGKEDPAGSVDPAPPSEPAPPAEAESQVGNPQARREAGAGVISLLRSIQDDLRTEVIEAKTEEEHAQAQYAEVMRTAQNKRQEDIRAITQKEGVHADLAETLNKDVDFRDDLKTEVEQTATIIKNLHDDCDWLVQSYDVRKIARAGEVESLRQATAVLRGADVALAQKKKSVRR